MIDNTQKKRVSFLPYKGIDQRSFLQRRKLAVKAAIVGAFSGLVAVAFRMGLKLAEDLRHYLFYHYTGQTAFFPKNSVAIFGVVGLEVFGLLNVPKI